MTSVKISLNWINTAAACSMLQICVHLLQIEVCLITPMCFHINAVTGNFVTENKQMDNVFIIQIWLHIILPNAICIPPACVLFTALYVLYNAMHVTEYKPLADEQTSLLGTNLYMPAAV